MHTSQDLPSYLLDIFRWLHRHPELSYEEIETTHYLRSALEKANIRILDLPLKTGLVAEIGQGSPIIALRADIDALPIEEQTELPYKSKVPGCMHACGHDFHATAVLGAALLLKEQEQDLPGTVRIIFQPAEEAPGGARVIMDTGVLNDVSSIFGIHTSPLLPVGTLGIKEGAVTASVDRFQITFRGRGTHAAHPQRGIDPIPLTAAFIQTAQTIVSRSLYPFAAGLVSITHVEAGNTWNIIPETALVEGTTRSLTTENRALIKKRLYEQAENLAAAYGAQAEIDWYAGPPATDNTAAFAELACRVAAAESLQVTEAPGSLAGEDFAYFQEKIPGLFLLVGTGLSASNHNPKFQADPAALFPTARYLSHFIKSVFRQG